MVNVTFAVDEDTKHRMDEFTEINWSAVARSAVEKRIEELEFLEKITKNSDLTELDAIELGRKINAEMATRYRKLRTGKKR